MDVICIVALRRFVGGTLLRENRLFLDRNISGRIVNIYRTRESTIFELSHRLQPNYRNEWVPTSSGLYLRLLDWKYKGMSDTTMVFSDTEILQDVVTLTIPGIVLHRLVA